MEYFELKNEITSVVEKAENIAIEDIANNIEFSPFLIYGKDGNKIKRLIVESIDEAIDIAEEEIEDIDDGSETVILCFKDKISLKDGVFNAIVYQIYNIDEDNGYSYGQVYSIEEGKIKFLNKKVFLENIRNPLIF